jgi:hypothetical protein
MIVLFRLFPYIIEYGNKGNHFGDRGRKNILLFISRIIIADKLLNRKYFKAAVENFAARKTFFYRATIMEGESMTKHATIILFFIVTV